MSNVKHILLSSPDRDLQDYLRAYLPCLGPYEVQTASTLMEAVAKVNAFAPELFICVPECLDPSYQNLAAFILNEFPPEKTLLLCRNRKKLESAIGPSKCHILSAGEHYTELSRKIKSLLPEAEQDSEHEFARLLIADDEEGILEVLNDLFEGLGIEVYKARDGEHALEILKRNVCNLVILDLRMPHFNGDELVKKIITDDRFVRPKQMMIVTASLGSTLNDVKRLGIPVMSKPVSVSEIEESVLEACKKYHLSLRK